MDVNPRNPVILPQAEIEAIHGLHIVASAEVAAATVFLYDLVLMLAMEVNLVWKKKWTPMKALYLVQRCVPLIDVCFLPLYRQLGTNMTKSKCEPLLSLIGVFFLIGSLASELLITICVWAIWNRNKRLTIALSAVAIILTPPASVAGRYFLSSIEYSANPPYSGFMGCFIIKSKPYIIWTWLALGVWDFMCLILVLIPCILYRASASQSQLRRVIYRDGLIFYVFNCIASFTNVLLNALLPPSTRVLGTSLARCLHSIFASRALLHMREQAQGQEEFIVSSTIEFRAPTSPTYED